MQPLVICGEINFDIASRCLDWLAKNRTLPVEIWLCSEGGDTSAGMAIYGAIQSHPEEVSVTVFGACESIASVILQAADCRKICSTAFIQLHRGTVSLEEITPDEQVTTAAFLTHYYDALDNLVYLRMKASGAKISRKRYREEVQAAVFYTAEEALKAGLVDEVLLK